MKLPSVTVCSYEEAEYYLGARPLEHDAVISINDVHLGPPPGLHRFPGLKCALAFDDVVEPKWGVPPSIDHATEIVDFAKRLRNHRVLVHCAAGVSRSTAAAISIPATRMRPSPDNARSIMHWIATVRPVARPNPLLVSMIDELLGWDMTLSIACRHRFGAKDPPWG